MLELSLSEEYETFRSRKCNRKTKIERLYAFRLHYLISISMLMEKPKGIINANKRRSVIESHSKLFFGSIHYDFK